MTDNPFQQSLGLRANLPDDLYDFGLRTSGEAHGVVLTKPQAVKLILDLAGYTANRDLAELRLLEPSCGDGVFLTEAVRRLASAAARTDRDLSELERAITAFDIDPASVKKTQSAVSVVLRDHGVPAVKARRLSSRWIRRADYLLEPDPVRFDVIVGNPPYVRIEQLPSLLQAEYRARYKTLYDRADLYVAFIERSLQLLAPLGVLSFICADRWLVNKYGSALREFITAGFNLRTYVDLHSASPFESDVIAYPSIFSVTRGAQGPVSVCRLATGSKEEFEAVVPAIKAGRSRHRGVTVSKYRKWFSKDEPWITTSPAQLEILRSLEGRFGTLEASGKTKVRIGVATGDDGTYVVGRDADIEPDRLVPLVMRADIIGGNVTNGHRFVINTFDDDGRPIELSGYPKLAAYLRAREASVRRRHVSRRSGSNWFRTIDRVYPHLAAAQKLLIPDIAGANEIAFESGRFYPHHNLYFVTSEEWDMEVLGGLLSSRVALFFVWSYAVKMRGGYLRFQAQYLRRIRVPAPDAVPTRVARDIRDAFRRRDFNRLDKLALKAYSLESLPEFDFVDNRA